MAPSRDRVEAHPFAGTVETVLTEEDIVQYREQAARFAAGEQHVTFDGDRGARIALDRHSATVEVSVTPYGDDPWPLLRFLIFEAQT